MTVAGFLDIHDAPLQTLRAKSLLTNAQVISKAGDVLCRSGQDPGLVFAGGAIHVADSTIEGMYIAPRISIGTHARGGTFQVSHLLEAARFAHSRRGPVSVVLRHRLSCEDYGEYLDPEAATLIAKAAAIRQELDNYRRMIQIAESEIAGRPSAEQEMPAPDLDRLFRMEQLSMMGLPPIQAIPPPLPSAEFSSNVQ